MSCKTIKRAASLQKKKKTTFGFWQLKMIDYKVGDLTNNVQNMFYIFLSQTNALQI